MGKRVGDGSDTVSMPEPNLLAEEHHEKSLTGSQINSIHVSPNQNDSVFPSAAAKPAADLKYPLRGPKSGPQQKSL